MTSGAVRILVACVAASACNSALQWGIPRVPVSATSPDGGYIAFVRNQPNIDPPSQSLWVGRSESGPHKIQDLGPDSDWCNVIAWSGDSTTVSYLIQDARLITIDAASQRIVSERWLTPQDGYPTSRMAVDVSLSHDGRRVRFRECDRKVGRPGYVHDPTDCGPLQSADIRPGPHLEP